jgi:hypothetical protein
LTSGIINDRSFAIPLVIGWLLVSGRGASLLPDAIKIEVFVGGELSTSREWYWW